MTIDAVLTSASGRGTKSTMRVAVQKRWSRARRTFGALATMIVAVLVANGVVLATDTLDHDRSVATAAVALADSGAVPAEVDQVERSVEDVVVDIEVTEEIDPSVELPDPQAAPADPYAATPEVQHGQLEIPAIGLSQPLFEGVTLTAINRGPSHWPGTAMPGEVGNVVVAGHRTTYTKPFWALNELTPGDELIFTVEGERHVYELDELEVVHPTDIHIVDQAHERRATLFGCHPRGSARQRIVGHFVAKSTTSIELFESFAFFDFVGVAPPTSEQLTGSS